MKKLVPITLILLLIALKPLLSISQSGNSPVRIAIAGTTHGHSGWILGKKDTADVIVTGIYEKNTRLAQKQKDEFGLQEKIFYTDLMRMLDEVKPQAVVAFGSIYEHLEIVEACAPRGIHVMVEKPLAVSLEHAVKMEKLAKRYNIHLLTNYETSWYPTTAKVLQLVADSAYTGNVTKAVFHHGHEGPKEIGVGKEFLDWLTDPKLNGGGALIDFGCYGANIMTAIMGSVKPISVTAVTKTYKPETYPGVDDEATIIVDYPRSQAIIQASWNWPFGRKDMEVYGEKGFIITADAHRLKRKNSKAAEIRDSLSVNEIPVYTDPFKFFADVVRKKVNVPEFSVYSLSNNIRVVQILDAARESARTKKSVNLQIR